MDRKELGNRINNFIEKFAKRVPDGSGYGSPDAYDLLRYAQCLLNDEYDMGNARFPDSSFYQGGYKRDGKAEHQFLLEEIEKFINPYCKKCNNKTHISFNFCQHCGNPLK